jgi:alkyl sulfatase BDS1-like metallo-beta-lactamase superfamily hydrolase
VPTRPGAVHGSDSIVLALKSRFNPDAARDLDGNYELRLATDRYRIEISDGQLAARRGELDAPDAVIETDADTLGAVLLDGRQLDEALESGAIGLEGDRERAARLLALYR